MCLLPPTRAYRADSAPRFTPRLGHNTRLRWPNIDINERFLQMCAQDIRVAPGVVYYDRFHQNTTFPGAKRGNHPADIVILPPSAEVAARATLLPVYLLRYKRGGEWRLVVIANAHSVAHARMVAAGPYRD